MNIRDWIDKEGLKQHLNAANIHYFTLNGVMEFNNKALALSLAAAYDPLPTIRTRLKAQLVVDAQNYVEAAILSKYPKFEIDTWQNQLSDAQAYLNDNLATTITLDSLSNKRGKNKEELANKIIEKYQLFSVFSGEQAGERQRIEDLIDSGETAEELNAIPAFAGV